MKSDAAPENPEGSSLTFLGVVEWRAGMNVAFVMIAAVAAVTLVVVIVLELLA